MSDSQTPQHEKQQNFLSKLIGGKKPKKGPININPNNLPTPPAKAKGKIRASGGG